MVTRQQAAEAFEARVKIVAERILKNLAYSPHHAHMGALQRIDLAYKMAEAELSESLTSEEPPIDFPGISPDGFFIEQE
jgi:hypothetical protein